MIGIGESQLVDGQNEKKTFEEVEHDEVDGCSSQEIARVGELLVHDVQQAGQAAGVEKANVQTFDVVVVLQARLMDRGRMEVDQRCFDVVEHLRGRHVKVELRQTAEALVGVRLFVVRRQRDEAAVEHFSRVRIERNLIENLTGRIAKARIAILASQIGDVDEKLIVIVFLREYLEANGGHEHGQRVDLPQRAANFRRCYPCSPTDESDARRRGEHCCSCSLPIPTSYFHRSNRRDSGVAPIVL